MYHHACLPCVCVQMAARDHIVECVKEVFCRHGAVPMFSLDVGFATAEDPKGAMQVGRRVGEGHGTTGS